MILVTGGTGHLGTELVPLLTAKGERVRVLTRDPARALKLLGSRAEFVQGDVANGPSLRKALAGVDAVVSAMTGFGPGGAGPRAVDHEGNLNMIREAEAAGVRRFVLLSMYGAAPDHLMELARMKFRAEEALRASRLDWVIVRPNSFMELWADFIGASIIKDGKATVFGRGDNPVNFNSVKDLARFIEIALVDPGLGGTALDVGGPENLTFNDLVGQVERSAGRKAAVRHVPVALMRLLSLMMRPVKPDVAGLLEGGVAFDRLDMTFDASDLRRRFPQVELTRLADVLDRRGLAAAAPLG